MTHEATIEIEEKKEQKKRTKIRVYVYDLNEWIETSDLKRTFKKLLGKGASMVAVELRSVLPGFGVEATVGFFDFRKKDMQALLEGKPVYVPLFCGPLEYKENEPCWYVMFDPNKLDPNK